MVLLQVLQVMLLANLVLVEDVVFVVVQCMAVAFAKSVVCVVAE
jgi:hypothetical protein